MATRAERFKATMQREAKPKQPKKPKRRRRDWPVDTAQPGVSATDRKAGHGSTAARNRSLRAGRKGGAALEDSLSGRPSRKSTRKSEGSLKTTSNLQRRQVRRVSSPKARATRSKS
jgi:hypothetical protein